MSEHAPTAFGPGEGTGDAGSMGDSRRRVLALLGDSDTPISAQQIADSTGLHANTARFHLEGLVHAGLAVRGNDEGGRPGRPRTVYRATSRPPGGTRRNYRLLAEMLTSLITESVDEPAVAAVEAGRQWGRYLVDRPAPTHRVDAADALARLRRVLVETGFVARMGSGGRIRLPRCPFRDIACQHREVVCGLHLGLMQGALAEVRAPLVVDHLEPFVTPSLCVAYLDRAEPAETQR